jgi:hypothetical protein
VGKFIKSRGKRVRIEPALGVREDRFDSAFTLGRVRCTDCLGWTPGPAQRLEIPGLGRAYLCRRCGAEVELVGRGGHVFDGLDRGKVAAMTAPNLDPGSLPELPPEVLLSNERKVLGYYLSGHPVFAYESSLKPFVTCTFSRLGFVPCDAPVRLAAVVESVEYRRGHKGRWARCEVSDPTGSGRVHLWPKKLAELSKLVFEDSVLILTIRFNRGRDPVMITVDGAAMVAGGPSGRAGSGPSCGYTRLGHVVDLPVTEAQDRKDPVRLVAAVGWPRWRPRVKSDPVTYRPKGRRRLRAGGEFDDEF